MPNARHRCQSSTESRASAPRRSMVAANQQRLTSGSPLGSRANIPRGSSGVTIGGCRRREATQSVASESCCFSRQCALSSMHRWLTTPLTEQILQWRKHIFRQFKKVDQDGAIEGLTCRIAISFVGW